MIVDLDHETSLDPGRVGSKAAWLATGRKAGLPILPGFVVEGEVSRHHMELGAETLLSRGSGGARLAVAGETFPSPEELISAGERLGPSLVARSSTALEGSGEWSGAFTSYLDLAPTDLPKAVVGCWAAAFSVEALNRQLAASIEPGSFLMPVLIQPAVSPEAGGTAEIESDGSIVVQGITGSPAPLLQGWIAGLDARQSEGDSGWSGDDLIDLVGTHTLNTIANSLRQAHSLFGANRCEWAVDDVTWILQLDVIVPVDRTAVPHEAGVEVDPAMIDIARAAMRAPGRLGEELVLPWALSALPQTGGIKSSEEPAAALAQARQLAGELTSQVWDLPLEEALRTALGCMRELRGPDPTAALRQVKSLNPPNIEVASVLMSLVDVLRAAMVDAGAVADPAAAWHSSVEEIGDVLRGGRRIPEHRIGIGQWEPLVATVVLACGTRHDGTPASSGIGAGIRSKIDEPTDMDNFSPRDVVTTSQPVPNLAPLLWNAAGLVTESGSPAAHLFESARSLGIPAVCGVSLPDDQDLIVAVDGHRGVVATLPL